MKQYLDLSEVALTDDDYEFIQFELRAHGEVFYVPYSVSADAYLKSDANANAHFENNAVIPHNIWISIPLIECKIIYEYPAISSEISDALLKLHSVAPEFLTQSGITHIEKLKQAEYFTEKSPLLVIDAYGGKRYQSEDRNVETSVLPVERKQAMIEGGDFYYRYEVTKKYMVPVKIVFSSLIQSEVDVL